MSSKFTASQARAATLILNGNSSSNALETVVDKVWSDDFWIVMEDKVGLTRDIFMHQLTTGRQLTLMMTVEQCDMITKLHRIGTSTSGMVPVFQYLSPKHVSANRINYCEKCGAYHEEDAVFEIMSDTDREDRGFGQVMPWDDGDDYGVFCGNCGNGLQIGHDGVYASENMRRNHPTLSENACFASVGSLYEVVSERRDNGSVNYLQQQLEASDLDFLSYMSQEDYDAIPK